MTRLELEGIDPERCARRNRLAALRFGIHTVPLRLAAEPKAKRAFSRGRGPANIDEALSLINELKPPDSPTLKAEDVWVLPVMQAANSNFIPSRHLFLGTSTLKNIQRSASEGFAFMNSHRTGSLSTPSELPLGRTFAGRFEQFELRDRESSHTHERALLWTYMLQGIKPNGANGPSTDDLYKMVSGGVLNDVSMGLNGGSALCDLCGYDIRDDNCPHVPGTSLEMTKDQQNSQRLRGVPAGLASYTLEDAQPGEVSGVYDGAVPGAGFSKAVQFARAGDLKRDHLLQARHAYADLMNEGDFPMADDNLIEKARRVFFPQTTNANAYTITWGSSTGATGQWTLPPGATLEVAPDVLSQYSEKNPPAGDDSDPGDETTYGDDLNDADEPAEPAQAPVEEPKFSAGADDAAVLLAREQQRRIELEQQVLKMRQAQTLRQAQDVVAELSHEGRLLPAGMPFAYALVQQLMLDDEGSAVTLQLQDNTGRAHRLSRVQAFQMLFSGVPSHDLLKEHPLDQLPGNAIMISAVEGDEDVEARRLREKTRKIAGPKTRGRHNGRSNGRAYTHDYED